jgi:hypothetical protein
LIFDRDRFFGTHSTAREQAMEEPAVPVGQFHRRGNRKLARDVSHLANKYWRRSFPIFSFVSHEVEIATLVCLQHTYVEEMRITALRRFKRGHFGEIDSSLH